MNYCLGKMDPIWAKCLKSGQNCSRSGQFFFIHFRLRVYLLDSREIQQLQVNTVRESFAHVQSTIVTNTIVSVAKRLKN